MRRRVVVTGVGAITPVGQNPVNYWAALQAGRSGVGRISLFDASGFPTQIAGEVKDFDVAQHVPNPRPEWKEYGGRNINFALAAAQQAFRDAGLADVLHRQLDPNEVGVYLGAGEGRQDFFNFVHLIYQSWKKEGAEGQVDHSQFIKQGMNILHPLREMEQDPGMSTSHIAELFDLRGPNLNCLTACAASSQAIGEATAIIRRGDATVMLSGGTHSMLHPLGVSGFNLLTALSQRNAEPTRASRPFDAQRDGFVIGEGAAIVVLEELDHALARGAQIYGEITGYGSTADAFRVTDTHPSGRGAIACMKAAIQDGKLNLDEIDYINAHGTSTDINDRVETLAIKEVFGAELAKKIPVSSIKSMTGHLIAAAGAAEVIACLFAIRDHVMPPTINYENPDKECDLDYIPNEARQKSLRHTLSNSFGFGGQNVSLIISRFESVN